MLIFFVTDSDYGDNQYGKNPKLYPDTIHANESKVVLTAFLSILALVITISTCRVAIFIEEHKDEIMNDGSSFDLDDLFYKNEDNYSLE